MNRLASVRSAAVLFLIPAFWSPQAIAQDADLQQCLSISEIEQRVACYDALARDRQGLGQPAAPAVAPPTPPAAPAVRTAPVAARSTPDSRREFGLSAAEREAARPQPQAQLDELTVVIASLQARGMGYWQFTTTEGVTWRLTETSRNFRPPRKGDEVQIRRGRLGSYYLEAGGQPSIRVVRVD